MARPKKIKADVQTDNQLLSALKFVGLIAKDIGTPSETHVRLQSNWTTASNGILALGHPIKENLYCCPQNKLFLDALSKCEQNYELTQNEHTLSIKSNKFKAIIPCLSPELINCIGPDDPIAIIDNRLKEGFEAVGMPETNNAQLIYNASILLNGQSIVGTDGKVIIEYWHGIDLPKGLPIPKNLIGPLTKSGKALAKFGFSPSSVTFWFDDGSWIKSQLYVEEWPDIATVLDRSSQQKPVPPDFFNGLDSIKGFTDAFIYFGASEVRSHQERSIGASYAVEGLPEGPVFNLKQLLMIKPYVETIDFQVPGPYNGNMLLWFGRNVRGAVAGISLETIR